MTDRTYLCLQKCTMLRYACTPIHPNLLPGFLPYVIGTNGKQSFFNGILPIFSQRNR